MGPPKFRPLDLHRRPLAIDDLSGQAVFIHAKTSVAPIWKVDRSSHLIYVAAPSYGNWGVIKLHRAGGVEHVGRPYI
ncbi:hypothetical protein EC915_10839 [Pseudomonas sp. LP_7_YM]|nr:hypothetical protein EC915_10839 [Pseudomonas sp. LP_7_YM]